MQQGNNDSLQFLQESISSAKLRRSSLLNFVKNAIGQRIGLLRDLIGFSLVLLGGVITILSIGKAAGLVRTPALLYAAGVVVVVNITISLYSRVVLLQHLQRMVAFVESGLTRIVVATREIRRVVGQQPPATPDQITLAINGLVQAEQDSTPTPKLNWLGEHGYELSTGLFISALVSVVVALLFHIT